VLMSRHDAERLGLRDGDPVRLASRSGAYTGRARTCEMKPGNLEVHWPEGNVLLCREEIDIASHEPDYNAVVSMEKA
jgi:anaerobic selenocysteine-containing dehydrogenase